MVQLAGPPSAGLSEAEARRADLLWAAGVSVGILLLFVMLSVARGAAGPVFISAFFAYALNPIIGWCEKRGMARNLAILLLFLAMAVAFTGALVYLVPTVGAEFTKLPEFIRDITTKAVPRVEALLGQPLPSNVRDAAQALSAKGGGIAEKVLPGLAGIALGALGGTASLLASVLGLLVVIPVLTFYLLSDFNALVAFAKSLLPRRYEPLVAWRFAEVDSVLGAFIRGQVIVGAILACVYALGLSLARIDLAVVIGAVAGFGSIIPYVGPGIGIGLSLLAAAISWQGAWQLGVIGATFGLGMAAEGLFITPRVVGEKVGLSPLAVMVAILAFAEVFGFLGVLLAVPVTAALKVVGSAVIYRYRRSATYRGDR